MSEQIQSGLDFVLSLEMQGDQLVDAINFI